MGSAPSPTPAVGGLRLYSRNDRDVTANYPEIEALGVGERVVLDGELVALDERGRPDFGRLQRRMHVPAPTATLLAYVPVQYVVFDLLRHDGRPTIGLPYLERRALLDGLDLDDTARIRVPSNFRDIAGSVVLTAAEQQGLEGVVAKRIDSTYQPGRRSRSWIKTAIRHTHEVIIAGWSAGAGSRHNSIGALLLAAHDDDRLVYVGDVGTGFTDAARHRLLEQLQGLERPGSPFDGEFTRARGWPGRAPSRGGIRWVEPVLVGEIEYRFFTRDGSFRHPFWRGLCPDRDPVEVQLPIPERPKRLGCDMRTCTPARPGAKRQRDAPGRADLELQNGAPRNAWAQRRAAGVCPDACSGDCAEEILPTEV